MDQDQNNRQSVDYPFKIVIVGDSRTGKTNLLQRFAEDTFIESTVGTTGVNFKTIYNSSMKLQVWDTAWWERPQTITTSHYRGAHGIIIVYDCTNQNSFNNIKVWLEAIDKHCSATVCKIIVGTKCDLQHRKTVDYKTAQDYAEQLGIRLFEVSAKSGKSVEAAFQTLDYEIFLAQNKRKQEELLVLNKRKQEEQEKKQELEKKLLNELLDQSGREVKKFNPKGDVLQVASRWKIWKRAFELYLTAKDIKDDKIKKATLLHCVGPSVQVIYFSLESETMDADKRDERSTSDYERAIRRLDKAFYADKNPMFERLVFRKMEQNDKENIEQYVHRLADKVEYCEFGTQTMVEEQLRDQIVASCRSAYMRNSFVKEGIGLTLTKILEISAVIERSQNDVRSIQNIHIAVYDMIAWIYQKISTWKIKLPTLRRQAIAVDLDSEDD